MDVRPQEPGRGHMDVRPQEPLGDLEVEGLRRDLEEAREQQRASSEVLSVLGRSKSDLKPLFETVVEHARRLCRADAGQIYIAEGRVYRLAVASGGSSHYRQLLARSPIAPGNDTLVGKVSLEHVTIHIPDVVADPDYHWPESQQAGGQRTMLGVPMLSDGEVIGVISLIRTRVDPFAKRQIDLVSTFATQATIAIQNGHLFKQLEARTVELADSVEELQALSAVGEAVSSTLDLEEVLKTIVTHAVQLSETDGGSIFEFDQDTQEFRVRTTYGTGADLVRALRAARIRLGETAIGRSAALRRPQALPDLDMETPDPHIEQLLRHGWKSMLAVPLLREDRILGALVVRRKRPGEFAVETAELLERFASQSALAIQNAHLFREIGEKSRQVEVASAHKSEFLASMSHELRTPLNAVIGFSEVLLDGMFGELNDKQREYLNDIRDSGRHLLELLNEILDLSKIEAGRMELEPGAFSLVEVLERGMAMVRDRAAQHSLELALEVEPGVDVIVADQLRIKQVILNLVTNAVKFTPDGGRVKVRAREFEGRLEVTVRDTGIGIAPEDREKIFQSFQTGGRDAKAEEGTGLGLTLSRKIVELHGGRIWVESEVGRGSTFGFTLPLRSHEADDGHVAPRPPTRERAASSDDVPTILLIEDEENSIDLLSLHLGGAGFAVEVARDGRAGLESVRKLRPAGIVLDIVLPELDGWDVLAALKADPELADIPVIVVSMLDERGKGFALGASEYLVKPVGRREVQNALERCVHGGGVASRTVLVIDDDPRAVELLEATFADQGYAVLTATGGEQGLELARRELPAVVLLDLLMPGIDGFAVVERLRADPATAAIPIVILTSKTMTPDDKHRLNGQISYLAHKGEFDREALIELVGRLSRVASPA